MHYTNDTVLMTGSKRKLKGLFDKVINKSKKKVWKSLKVRRQNSFLLA